MALVACALAVPAAIADEAGSAGLKKDVKKALTQAKKAKKKAGAANKKAKDALAVTETTSKQAGPQGPKGDKGDPGPKGDPGDPAPTLSSGRVTINFGETKPVFSSGPFAMKVTCVGNDGGVADRVKLIANSTEANSTFGVSSQSLTTVFGPGDSTALTVAGSGTGTPNRGAASFYATTPSGATLSGNAGASVNLAGSDCIFVASATE